MTASPSPTSRARTTPAGTSGNTSRTDYTLIFITRYDPQGSNHRRILDNPDNNTLWGHLSGTAHRVHRNGQDMTDANGQIAHQYYGETTPNYEWSGICTPNSFTVRGSVNTEWHVADQVSGSHGTVRPTIRNGQYSPYELADWHIAELIMYDRVLSDEEVTTIKAWIDDMALPGAQYVPSKPSGVLQLWDYSGTSWAATRTVAGNNDELGSEVVLSGDGSTALARSTVAIEVHKEVTITLPATPPAWTWNVTIVDGTFRFDAPSTC